MAALRTPRTDIRQPAVTATIRIAAAVAFCVAAAVTGDSARAQADPSAGRLALKGGVPEHDTVAVGLLLSRSCPSGRCGVYARCSGVLGPDGRFFTAGHCVMDRERDYWVFLPYTGIIPAAESGIRHFCDGFDDCDAATHDLASLRLAIRIADVPVPQLGSDTTGSVRIVGFGDSGPARADHGILRAAPVTTVSCEPGLICYRFTSDSAAACNHDSGGPMFRGDRVIGLARRSEYGCVEGRGTYTDLTGPRVAAWWKGPTESLPTTTVPADQRLARDCVEPSCWRVRPGVDEQESIQVHPGARRLIVTLNHAYLATDADCSGGLRACAVDYDLRLAGPLGGAPAAGCTCRNDLFQVAACTCADPQPGRWRIVIDAVGERGPYQINGRVVYAATAGEAAASPQPPGAAPASSR
jgi:hypothetical protein